MSEVVVRRRRSRTEAEVLVAEFEASGLKREAFCRQRGLAIGTLDKYRQRCMVGGDWSPGRWFLLKWFGRGRRRQAAMSMDIAHSWLSREAGVGSKCVVDSMWRH